LNGDILIDLGRILTRFQGHGTFEVEYLKKRCILGTKLRENANRKPYPVYRMVPLSMTLIDS